MWLFLFYLDYNLSYAYPSALAVQLMNAVIIIHVDSEKAK